MADSQPDSSSDASRSGPASGDSYLVAARKYRPALFKEVVAQEHVTDTLKNALKLDRLAHAYLFSGPRGVGKTTTARILAKAINCETPREEREDEAEPCRTCDSCQAFEAGRSLNVFEMDAASNNKVDDIRELRETVRIPPQGSTKKVYILDEVHMLSTQAFNALLKTLEEPPPHALFIFATTEPHKVLPTILSRCQRFDFRRIPVPRIVNHLRRICDNEGIDADEESLMLLARKGDGALRDALSAFDQAISLCGTTLEYSDLTQALGVVDQDLFFRLTDHIAEQDTAGVLQLVNHVVRSGYDLQEFLTGLAEHLRNLLVARSLGENALEEVATSTQSRYAQDAQRFGEADLLRLLTLAGDAEDAVKTSSQPRLKLEMTLLKMAQMRRAADLKTVLQKIDRLEQMVEEGEIPDTLDAAVSPSAGSSSSTPAPDSSADSAPADPDPASADDPPAEAAGDSTVREDERAYDASSPAGEAPDVPREQSATDAAADASAGAEAEGEAEREASDTERLPEEPDDPAFTTPFDEDDESPADDDASGDSAAAGEGHDDEDEGQVAYGDLFGSPALDEGKPGKSPPSSSGSGPGSSSANRASEASSDGEPSGGAPAGGAPPSDAQGSAAEAQGDGQAAGDPQASVVAGPGGTATATEAETRSPVLDTVDGAWSEIVQTVMTEKISLGALLGDADPQSFDGQTLVIAAPKALHRDQFRTHKRYLLDKLQTVASDEVGALQFVVDRSTDTANGTSSNGSTETLDPREKMEQLRDTYPALDRLFDQFGAELVW